MTLQKISLVFRQMVRAIYGEKVKQFKYLKHIFICLGIVLSCVATFMLYRFYVMYRERASQKVFSEYVELFQKEHAEDGEWQKITAQFQHGYDQHSGSYLAPYYLSFQADGLLKQGKKNEAIGVMDEMIQHMPVSSPILSLFKTKRALIKLDSDDEAIQQEAVQELEVLAKDSDNQFQDLAQFYLGRYYWSNDQIVEAKQVWQQLVDEQRKQRLAPSPWAEEVKNVVETIIAT